MRPPAGLRLLTGAFPPLVVAGHFQRALEDGGVLAGVVNDAGGRLVRELLRRYEVAAAHLGRVETQLLGNQVNGALHAEGRLGPASAAVGTGDRLVGGNADDFDRHRGRAVGASEPVAGENGHRRSGHKEKCAQVCGHVYTDTQDGAIALRCGFEVDAVAAPVEAQHVFLATLHPLYGPSELHSQVRDGNFLGEEAALLAVAAANVRADQPDRVQRTAHQAGDVLANLVGVLRRVPDGQVVGVGVVLHQQAAPLHGGRCQPLYVELLPDGAVGEGERLVEVAASVYRSQHDVGAEILVDHRRVAGQRLRRVYDGGQDFVVDVHQVHGVLGGVDVICQDDGHRLTGVAGLADGQRRMPGRVHLVRVG